MRLSEERLLTAFEELEGWLFKERTVRFAESLTAKKLKRERGEPVPHQPTDPDHFLGLDIGLKRTRGLLAPQPCICIFVRRKLSPYELPSEVKIPSEVRGVPTDVIPVGNIRAPLPISHPLLLKASGEELQRLKHLRLSEEQPAKVKEGKSKLSILLTRIALDAADLYWAAMPTLTACSRRRTKYMRRPVPAGVSIGHPQITAGTLGYLAQDGKKLFILSNNHVLADSNKAKAGDPILQPGPYDGGKEEGRFQIGTLTRFVPIQFGQQNLPNEVDAALAETEEKAVRAEICSIGKVTGIAQARRGLLVQKHGRTTGRTFGVTAGIHAKIWVDYDGRAALFSGQLRIEGGQVSFSAGGDSGSLIMDMKGRAVGLLFAGSDVENITFANPIRPVLQALEVRIVSEK